MIEFSPVLFFVSLVMAGLGVAILAYVAAGRLHSRPARSAVKIGLARVVGWVSLLYLLLKLGELGVAGELPRPHWPGPWRGVCC